MIEAVRCTISFKVAFVVFLSASCLSLVGGEPATPASDTLNSGLEGTTRSEVISGMPGGMTTRRAASMEFAIAPLDEGKPVLARVIFVRSDGEGKYRVALPPGAYWIGSKRKALGLANPPQAAVEFRETTAVVTKGVFAHLDLLQVSYGP